MAPDEASVLGTASSTMPRTADSTGAAAALEPPQAGVAGAGGEQVPDILEPSQPQARGTGEPGTALVSGDILTPPAQRETPGAPGDVSLPKRVSAAMAPGEPQAADPLTTWINDEHFIRDLERLKDLRSFLIQEAVGLSASDSAALEFGRLNLLRYNVGGLRSGRDPTAEEWNQVERSTRILFGLLTPALRRRFILGGIPRMLSWVPVILGAVGLASLILAVISYNTDLLRLGSLGANVLPFYLIWLMSLGAIGAVAFIGMNALSVQEDITFDLTNTRLIALRIALGALFGLVLTLPFGFDGFLHFCQGITAGKVSDGDAAASAGQSGVAVQAIMLVLPFILGFSTSLVILILNRFVDAVQGFFGRRDSSVPAPVTGVPTSPPG